MLDTAKLVPPDGYAPGNQHAAFFGLSESSHLCLFLPSCFRTLFGYAVDTMVPWGQPVCVIHTFRARPPRVGAVSFKAFSCKLLWFHSSSQRVCLYGSRVVGGCCGALPHRRLSCRSATGGGLDALESAIACVSFARTLLVWECSVESLKDGDRGSWLCGNLPAAHQGRR
jgi:hypothetical protein